VSGGPLSASTILYEKGASPREKEGRTTTYVFSFCVYTYTHIVKSSATLAQLIWKIPLVCSLRQWSSILFFCAAVEFQWFLAPLEPLARDKAWAKQFESQTTRRNESKSRKCRADSKSAKIKFFPRLQTLLKMPNVAESKMATVGD